MRMNLEELIGQIREDKSLWKFSNGILYSLCKEHPLHVKKDEIIAKIWLIGRSYAASLERGANKSKELFYEERVVRAILEKSKEIDGAIKLLSENHDEKNVFNAYWTVLERFHEISGKWNVSLTSKYLHFHCPDVFFLYDSRASKAIGKVVKCLGLKNSISFDEIKEFITCKKTDAQERMGDYVKFYKKCNLCVSEIRKRLGQKLSIRDFDNLLLRITDKEISLNDIDAK